MHNDYIDRGLFFVLFIRRAVRNIGREDLRRQFGLLSAGHGLHHGRRFPAGPDRQLRRTETRVHPQRAVRLLQVQQEVGAAQRGRRRVGREKSGRGRRRRRQGQTVEGRGRRHRPDQVRRRSVGETQSDRVGGEEDRRTADQRNGQQHQDGRDRDL